MRESKIFDPHDSSTPLMRLRVPDPSLVILPPGAAIDGGPVLFSVRR